LQQLREQAESDLSDWRKWRQLFVSLQLVAHRDQLDNVINHLRADIQRESDAAINYYLLGLALFQR
jgi:hypothetical protein